MRKYYKENNETTPAIKFEEVQPAGYSLITDPIELQELHTERYEQNRLEGINYYNHFQAQLYIDINTGTYTVTEVVALETHLKSVADEIKAGSWLTAQQTLPTITLSGIFTQAMKDEIQADIDNYILENY